MGVRFVEAVLQIVKTEIQSFLFQFLQGYLFQKSVNLWVGTNLLLGE